MDQVQLGRAATAGTALAGRITHATVIADAGDAFKHGPSPVRPATTAALGLRGATDRGRRDAERSGTARAGSPARTTRLPVATDGRAAAVGQATAAVAATYASSVLATGGVALTRPAAALAGFTTRRAADGAPSTAAAAFRGRTGAAGRALGRTAATTRMDTATVAGSSAAAQTGGAPAPSCSPGPSLADQIGRGARRGGAGPALAATAATCRRMPRRVGRVTSPVEAPGFTSSTRALAGSIAAVTTATSRLAVRGTGRATTCSGWRTRPLGTLLLRRGGEDGRRGDGDVAQEVDGATKDARAVGRARGASPVTGRQGAVEADIGRSRGAALVSQTLPALSPSASLAAAAGAGRINVNLRFFVLKGAWVRMGLRKLSTFIVSGSLLCNTSRGWSRTDVRSGGLSGRERGGSLCAIRRRT